MGDAIMELVEGAVGSPWLYPALLAFAALDAVLPLVPSESLLITAGVFAADDGDPNVALVIAVAALGAFAGDHASYFLGRVFGQRASPGSRQAAAFEWAANVLERRGGLILIVCRYIPGARTAITLTAGASGYPLRSFSFYDAIAAISWAAYGTMVGYIGGSAFEDDPLRGLLLGFGLALGVTLLVEVTRHLLRRRRRMPSA